MWAITTYFNPVGYRRRKQNYRRFRENLSIPLLAVELGFENDFELTDGDADILIQLRGGNVMWQKERLLNVAMASLPRDCRLVAWIDCDVLFARDGWAEAAAGILDQRSMVQLFSEVSYLPADHTAQRPQPQSRYFTRPSIASMVGPDVFAGWEGRGAGGLGPAATGLAWAARRELVEMHGFYDACIVGGGDSALFAAAHRAPEHSVQRQRMAGRMAEHYRAWADGFGATVSGDVAALNGRIYHLWHGDLAKRGRPARHEKLAAFDFDPLTDIVVDEQGSWRWASDKVEMHRYLRTYFAAPEEDGPSAIA